MKLPQGLLKVEWDYECSLNNGLVEKLNKMMASEVRYLERTL